jgi:hypothetical protein
MMKQLTTALFFSVFCAAVEATHDDWDATHGPAQSTRAHGARRDTQQDREI